MGAIKDMIEKQKQGIYVKSLEIGSNVVEVGKSSFDEVKKANYRQESRRAYSTPSELNPRKYWEILAIPDKVRMYENDDEH